MSKEIQINNSDISLTSIENTNKNNLDEEVVNTQEQIPIQQPQQIIPEIPMIDPEQLQDDLIYKAQLKSKITQYFNVFGRFLGKMILIDLDSKPIIELEILLKEVKSIVANRNIENNIKGIISMGPSIIEHTGGKVGLQLEGYAQLINSNDEYYLTCQEIILEYNVLEGINISPINRLVYILGANAMFLHQANAASKKALNDKLNTEVKDNIKEKFSDL